MLHLVQRHRHRRRANERERAVRASFFIFGGRGFSHGKLTRQKCWEGFFFLKKSECLKIRNDIKRAQESNNGLDACQVRDQEERKIANQSRISIKNIDKHPWDNTPQTGFSI